MHCVARRSRVFREACAGTDGAGIVTIDNVYKVLVGGRYALSDYRTEFAAWTYTAEAQQARIAFSITTDDNGNAVIFISVVRLK